MGALTVDVDAHENFIRQRLKRPPNEGLEDITGHVKLSEVTVTLRMRIAVVGGHEVNQPRLHHALRTGSSIKRYA